MKSSTECVSAAKKLNVKAPLVGRLRGQLCQVSIRHARQQRLNAQRPPYLALSTDLATLGTATAVPLFAFPKHCSLQRGPGAPLGRQTFSYTQKGSFQPLPAEQAWKLATQRPHLGDV